MQLNAAGIVVTWTSEAEEDGHVEWALSAAELAGSRSIASDVRGALAGRLNRRTHRVAITGVPGGSTIHYNLVSGGVTDPRGPYQVTIPSVALSAAPVGITGTVTYQEGSAGRECLIYIQIDHLFFGLALRSLPINAMTDGGGYAADVKNIRLEGSFDQPLIFGADSQDSTINVEAACDPENLGSLARTTAAADTLIVGSTVSEYQNMDVVVSPTVPVPLVTGFTLIGRPVRPPAPMTASGVAGQVADQGGQVAQVVRWSAGSQSYVLWSAASPEANYFAVQEGEGYFVLAVTPPPSGEWGVRGAPFMQPVALTFVVGLNLVSFPFSLPATSYDTAGLAQAVQDQGGVVAQVIRWEPGSQHFLLWSAASAAANVFPIDERACYFVLVTQPTAQPFELGAAPAS